MSGMTDQEAINTVDAYLPRHCRAALDHIAARLRGDGEQSDGIRALPAKWRASIDAASPHRPQDLRPIRFVLDLEAALSTQPAPSAPCYPPHDSAECKRCHPDAPSEQEDTKVSAASVFPPFNIREN